MSYVLIVKGLDEQTAKALRAELPHETVTVTAEMFELVTKGPKQAPSTNNIGHMGKLPLSTLLKRKT